MQWRPVHTGKSGARVWRGDGLHRKEASPSAIAAEAERLSWLAAHGLPCPRIVAHKPGVLVTTTVPGRSAAEPWPEQTRPVLVRSFATTLRALHALPAHRCPFDRSLAVTVAAASRAVAEDRVDLGSLDTERLGWSGQRLLAELHRTRPATEELVVGHGDPCLPNVFFDDDGSLTGLIDLDRLGAADRYNDLAIATRSLAQHWHPRYAEQFLVDYGLTHPDTAKIAFYRLLDEFF